MHFVKTNESTVDESYNEEYVSEHSDDEPVNEPTADNYSGV